MNLFRSEEHAKNWSGFKPGTEEGILPAADILAILSSRRHSEKFNGHYVTTCSDFTEEFAETIRNVTQNVSFWRPGKN